MLLPSQLSRPSLKLSLEPITSSTSPAMMDKIIQSASMFHFLTLTPQLRLPLQKPVTLTPEIPIDYEYIFSFIVILSVIYRYAILLFNLFSQRRFLIKFFFKTVYPFIAFTFVPSFIIVSYIFHFFIPAFIIIN